MPTRYREVVIQGPRGWTLGFLEGYLHGRGEDRRLLDAEAEGFERESLRERIKELLNPSMDSLHLLVPEELRPVLQQALEAAASHQESVTPLHEKPVLAARFSFIFSAYSKKHARLLRRLFEELPEGVELSADSSFEESVDRDAKGTEVYAPVHEYELSGRGTAEGPVEGIVNLHRACRDEELITVKSVELVLKED